MKKLLALTAILSVLAAGFYFKNYIVRAIGQQIQVTDFTSNSYTLEATTAHTYTFVIPEALNNGDDYFAFMVQRNYYANYASFCNASLTSLQVGSTDIAVDNSQPTTANDDGICTEFDIALGESVNIAAGSTIVAVVNDVANPSTEGTYFVYVRDGNTNESNYDTSTHQAFGTPVLKIKVVDPTGAPVEQAYIWVHNNYYTKNGGQSTGLGGYAFLFEDDFWLPEGVSIGDTYTVNIEAPTDSVYTNATDITGITLASGSTVDYTPADAGPISLTRPLITGTFVVPDGCATCTAGAGTTITDVDMDVRDSSFNPTNTLHTRADDNGQFKIGGLSAATYIIEFRQPYDMTNYRGLMAPNSIEFTVNEDGSVTYGGSDTAADSLPVALGDVEFQVANKTIYGRITKEDGTPLENVRVNAFKMMDPGMIDTTTDSNGQYELKVGGGNWQIMPQVDFHSNLDGDDSNDVDVSWVYCGMPKSASFANNDIGETVVNTNFKVKATTATITGTIKTPDDQAMTGGNAGIDVFSKDGCGAQSAVDPYNGTFTVNVPAGTYNIKVQRWDSLYASPPAKTITVGSGAVDIGDITMLEYTATISGRLWADANGNNTYDSGEGVGNVRVEAFKMGKQFDEFAGGPGGGPMGGGDWASTTSSNDDSTKGNFSLRVTTGSWVVNVMADPGMMGGYSENSVNYLYTGAPSQVNIQNENDNTSGHNFKLQIADATIQGRVVDSQGDGVSGIWGYAFAEPAGTYGQGPMMGMGMGGPINNSVFTLKVPAGSYKIGVDFPPESAGYTPSSTADVVAVSGQTVTVDVPVLENNATVRVQFKNSDGNLITDLSFAEVFMYNGAGGRQWRMLSGADLATGSVDIAVAPGTWNIGYFIDPSDNDYMSSPAANNNVTAVANQTVIKNITLKAADSLVSGTVYDPSGNPLSGVFVSVDSRKAANFNPVGGPMFSNGQMTGSDGTYSLNLPSGTYQVAAFYPPSAEINGQTVSYLNPAPQEVTISPTSPAIINLTFNQSDATISGTVSLNGSNQGAFVTAYSDNGGYNETTSTTGSYSLNVTSGTNWYIRAYYESGNNVYYSDVYQVTVSDSTTQNISLKQAPFTVPDPVSTTFNCANAKKITLSNGAEISIPASAIKPSSVQTCSSNDSSSNITITVSPTAQMSLQDKSIPVGVGYEITAKDSNGSTISNTFSSNVTITIPYSDSQITEAIGGNIDESLLGNGYWDTSTSSWRSVNSQTIDTDNNTLTISTNHFTLFGVLAATDPSATSTATSSVSTQSSSISVDSQATVPSDRPAILDRVGSQVVLMIGRGAFTYDADIDLYHTDQDFTKPKPPLWLASGPFRLKIFRRTTGNQITQFTDPITIILRYSPVSLGAIPEKSLRINYYDTAKKRWMPLNSLLISDRHELAAVISQNHGLFALVGGYGYQGVAFTDRQTVTAVSSSTNVGLGQLPSPTPTMDLTPAQPLSTDISPPLPPTAPPQNFWGKVLGFFRSLPTLLSR